jgi:hypothetical protein
MTISLRPSLTGRLANVELGAKKSIALLLLILLTVGLCSTLHAVSTPLWFDEICTVIVSRLPSVSAIWAALDHAVDGNPPVYYLVARATRHVTSGDHLGYRLPSIVGLLGVVFCCYAILSRRVRRLSALVGTAFILSTAVAGYAYEARPYDLMLACVSAAVLAWQRVNDSRLYSAVLAVTLAAAVSLHYYAILVWPAFLLAETSVWIFRRRLRVHAWAALVVGAVPILFFAPLLLKVREYYGRNFWAKPSFRQAFLTHDWLFGFGDYWGLIFAVGITAILLYLRIPIVASNGRSRQGQAEMDVVPIEELILSLTLLWLPLIAVAAAKLGHGGMTERYMLPTVLGGALALGYVIDNTPGAGRALLLILLLMNYALSQVGIVKSALNGSLLEARATAAHEAEMIVTNLGEPELPIVFANGHKYLAIAYYTPSDLSRRLHAIADPQAAVLFHKGKSDSLDLNLLALRPYFPLQVEDFDDFVSKHREFILISGGADWWLRRLVHDGFTLRLVSAAEDKVYKVTGGP